MPFILEGLLTTLNAEGSVHVAALGPIVSPDLNNFILRPYDTSTTYLNLLRTRRGVFHTTDDAELIAQAAIHQLLETPSVRSTPGGTGAILTGACHWYDLEVRELSQISGRSEMQATVVDCGMLREFVGFNRAKHAVIEAAILASRVNHLPQAEILADFTRLKRPVEKTGGPAEHRALAQLEKFILESIQADPSGGP